MKKLKFIIVAFILAFASQVLAQTESSKVVWKNLQEKYDSFYDIKPVLENLSGKPIYLFPSYYSVKIAFFDEPNKKWITSYPFTCGTGLKLKRYKIDSGSESQIVLKNDFWMLNLQNEDGLNLIESYRSISIGKFRLEIDYSIGKSRSYSFLSISPEFQVKIPKI
jgi:hypothetical protein